MDDQKLRQWAIEQAIAMHGAQGRTMEVILGEAKKLLEFVMQTLPRNEITSGMIEAGLRREIESS